MRRCQRDSSARRCAVVIGPCHAEATRTKGASQPGPMARAIASALRRAGLEAESSSTPGEPVLNASAGEASSARETAIAAAARAGRRRAVVAAAATRRDIEPWAVAERRAMRPALMRGPSRVRRAGRAPQAMVTLIAVTTTRAVASETSSVPGWRKAEAKSETKRVDPAKATVRPAVRRLRSAAAGGSCPAASSSRKRETMKRE